MELENYLIRSMTMLCIMIWGTLIRELILLDPLWVVKKFPILEDAVLVVFQLILVTIHFLYHIILYYETVNFEPALLATT